MSDIVADVKLLKFNNLMVKLLKLNVRINMVATSVLFCCSCHEENPLLHMPISEIEHVRNMIEASIFSPASYGDILAQSLNPENKKQKQNHNNILIESSKDKT